MTPLTSIVILTRNELAYTRRCVESIQQFTPEPHELVFVDNSSSDGTLDYLRAVPGAVVIDNDANLGFGGGCNQGIAASSGDRVLLLNNDVVVTAGWLAALHRELDQHATCGIAGPRSNRITGHQQVAEVEYDQLLAGDDLHSWARDWCTSHAGTSVETLRIVGFCMLIEREVLDRIGGFDLRFGLGNFEDDDICLRAGTAGYTLRVAHDSFVHHFGSRTFVGEGIDYRVSMGENYERFRAKWRMLDSDVDVASGGYRAGDVIARTPFDAARHYAPLVGIPDDGAIATIEPRCGTVATVCCDRLDPVGTRSALDAMLTTFGPHDDVTIAIRIDPRDAEAHVLLDQAADALGDANLPDIVLIAARDENDSAIIRASDVVLATGRWGRARADLARALGVSSCAAGDLALRLSERAGVA